MTDQLFESRLEARLRRYAERAVRPIDPTSVAERTIASGRSRWARGPRFRAVALVAIVALVATALLVGAILAGAGRPATPVPTDRGLGIIESSPEPAPSFASPSSCPTETVRVLLGPAMPAQVGQPIALGAGVVSSGAYLIASGPALAGRGRPTVPAELWSVRAGASTRIAVIDGPDINQVAVADVSEEAGVILVTVGRISGGGAHPECVDLYLFRADGSTVERVTHNEAGRVVGYPARLSSDDRYVAFPDVVLSPQLPGGVVHSGLAISDRLAASLEPQISPCRTAYGFPLAWAQAGDALAAVCDAQLLVEVGGSAVTVPVGVWAYDQVSFGWSAPRQVVIVSASQGSSAGQDSLDVRTVDVIGRGVGLDASLSPPRAVAVPFGPVISGFAENPISPDGSTLLVMRDAGGSSGSGYELVRLADGRATLVVAADALDGAWSSDGRSIIYVHSAGNGSYQLVVYDTGSGSPEIVRPLPAGYAGGVWRRTGS